MIIRILVGVPRNGKSVATNELFYDTLVLSADTIRETISPDKNKNYFKEEPFVWKCFSTMLEVACKQRVSDITIDNTNLRTTYRKQIIDIASSYGYRVEFLFISTPYEVIKQRCVDTEFDFNIVKNMLKGFNKIESGIVYQIDYNDLHIKSSTVDKLNFYFEHLQNKVLDEEA